MTKTTEASAEIQVRLEELNRRINEVRSHADSERATFGKAQAAFVSGGGSLDASLVAQQKLTLLEQALTSLENSKGTLENRLKQVVDAENAQLAAEQAAVRETERRELKAEFNRKFLEAGDRLEQSFAELLALKTEYNGLRNSDGQTSRGGSIVGIPEIEFNVTHPLATELFLAFGSHAHKAERLQEKARASALNEQRRQRETREPKREVILKNPQGKVSSSVNH